MFLLLACANDPAPSDAPTWHADVAPLVASRCEGCHTAGEIAPFPLTTYAEVSAVGEAVKAAVTDRRMPPWLAGGDCTEYRDDQSLTDEEIATVGAWVDAGMPEGDPAAAKAVEPAGGDGLSRVDHEIPLPEAYTPTQAPDDYRCFALEWPEDGPGYVTGYDIAPDNAAIVHHVVAYLAAPEDAETYRAIDEADPGAGWTCFGGPGVGAQEDQAWLGAWAPGGTDGDFPNGTGIYMEPGALIVLQMHYNTASAAAGPDRSAIQLRVDDAAAAPAYVQPFANPFWLDNRVPMEIPPNSTGVTQEFGYTFNDREAPFQIHNASLHMHTLGKSARLWLERADGTEDCLLDIPRWDFDWQRTYTLAEPRDVVAGDRLVIECTWDNPTDELIVWGEGTGDEMCLGTMLFSY
jgi:hypothetical protein